MFSAEQSFRWIEHVKAWGKVLVLGGSADSVAHHAEDLPVDKFGQHYTPLMTALTYAIAMDQKMQLKQKQDWRE